MPDKSSTPDEVQPREADTITEITDSDKETAAENNTTPESKQIEDDKTIQTDNNTGNIELIDNKQKQRQDTSNTNSTNPKTKSTNNPSDENGNPAVPDEVEPRQQADKATTKSSEDGNTTTDTNQATVSQDTKSLTPDPEQIVPRQESTTRSGVTNEPLKSRDNQQYSKERDDTAIRDDIETTQLETDRIRYDVGYFTDTDVIFEDFDGEKWSLREMHQVTDNKSDKAIAAVDVGKRGPLWKIVTKSPDDSIVEYETIEDGIIAVCKQLEYKSSNQTGLSEWSCKTARPEALAYREFSAQLYDCDKLDSLAESQTVTGEDVIVYQSLTNKTDGYRFHFGKEVPLSEIDNHVVLLQVQSNDRWKTVHTFQGDSLVDLMGMSMSLVFTGQTPDQSTASPTAHLS